MKMDIKGYEINYEIYGEGEPLVMLNGIMMSSASWKPFLDILKEKKLILIDLIDQGLSGKGKEEYTQEIHVDIIKELLDNLGIKKVNLFGISYGGEVAMQFALKYQEYLSSLILSNTTAYTSKWLKGIEELWDYAAGTHDGKVFFKATMPYIYSTKFYEENNDWLKEREEVFCKVFTPEWYEGFRRAIRSASGLNIEEKINKIKVPTLVIGADKDILIPLSCQFKIYERIENSKMMIIKDAGHAAMYEKPYEFASMINGFLSIYDKDIKIN
ncbi:alpha/beta fold hydrolase [Clostridium sp. DL1XJH146]